jgi:hypothetical protein
MTLDMYSGAKEGMAVVLSTCQDLRLDNHRFLDREAHKTLITQNRRTASKITDEFSSNEGNLTLHML